MNIAVLLSGGVDSSVALHLLKEQGHQVHAFYLKIWLEQDFVHLGVCPWEEDLRYATQVCDQLGVELSVINLQKEYWQLIIQQSIHTLKNGGTPSPDVLCNQQIKFDCFLQKIDTYPFDKIASGHYAQIIQRDGLFFLRQGADLIKDQSYFLCRLSQSQLSKCVFPIGHLSKAQVRTIATQRQLPTRDRKDSQGLCFLGKIKFSDFVKIHLGENPGLIKTVHNQSLGHHKGLWFHTIGQRQQLGLSGGPWYVVKKDTTTNTLVVCHQQELSQYSVFEFTVQDLQWIPHPPTHWERIVFDCKLRHGPQTIPCTITGKETSKDQFIVRLQRHDAGIASNQIAVFYTNLDCLSSAFMVA